MGNHLDWIVYGLITQMHTCFSVLWISDCMDSETSDLLCKGCHKVQVTGQVFVMLMKAYDFSSRFFRTLYYLSLA